MKTLVFGGSLKNERYSNKAINSLTDSGIEVVSYGLRAGEVQGVSIDTELIPYDNIHTITLYMNPQRQEPFYDYLLGLAPKRIIFNPGTENPDFQNRAVEAGIKTVNACTLVMLATNQYV